MLLRNNCNWYFNEKKIAIGILMRKILDEIEKNTNM